ncbi:MAG: hypothetical protein KGZ34_01925 [Nitrosarchaeum sp.]|nr:hypothetical protein [Nitrosarchaeum sp.]
MKYSRSNILLMVLLVGAVSGVIFTYNFAIGAHSFETGAATGTLPNAVTVVLAGQVLQPGDYLPLADYSPNYVTGHFLARIPCDSTGKPLVIPVAGHVDELPNRTWLDQAQLNLIEHVSNKGKTCVYHSHIPAVDLTQVGNPGAPRITDIGLLNLSDKNVVFRTGNAMSFTILSVVGNINPPNNYGPGGNMPLPYSCPGSLVTNTCTNSGDDIYPKFPSGTVSFDNGTHAGH